MAARPGRVTLKTGREKPLRQFHPWVFSGAIDQLEGDPGGIVKVENHKGQYLATGYFNPRSQITVRILTWDEHDEINHDWWRSRLKVAMAARADRVSHDQLTAYRLVYAESDGLPGLVIDRYGGVVVFQSLTLGIEQVKSTLVELMVELLDPAAIVERSDVDVRRKEGLSETAGIVYGHLPEPMPEIEEYGLRYPVDPLKGHKTGFYLDQRDARQLLLESRLAAGRDVLNAFGYSGAFSVCAAATGSKSVVTIDTSQPALDHAATAMKLNHLDHVPAEYVCADVFQELRTYRDQQRSFDLIILDPPKFAHSARDLERAARGYKDINLLAFQLLNPGGILMTFSCSGLVDADFFQKIVFGASVDAGKQAQIMGWLGQPSDHPILLSFPEGRYLKGLICRVAGF